MLNSILHRDIHKYMHRAIIGEVNQWIGQAAHASPNKAGKWWAVNEQEKIRVK